MHVPAGFDIEWSDPMAASIRRIGHEIQWEKKKALLHDDIKKICDLLTMDMVTHHCRIQSFILASLDRTSTHEFRRIPFYHMACELPVHMDHATIKPIHRDGSTAGPIAQPCHGHCQCHVANDRLCMSRIFELFD
jgi:hypothetical protein